MSGRHASQSRIKRSSQVTAVALAFSSLVVMPGVVSANSACVVTTETFVSGGVTYKSETISTVGVCDWTVPAEVTTVKLLLVGGGGGGGGGGAASAGRAGGGGGAGAQVGFTQDFSVTPGEVLTITVGAGGAFGVGGVNNGAAATTGSNGQGTQVVVQGIAHGVVGGQGGRGGGWATSGVGGDGGDSIMTMGGSPSGTQGGSGATALANGTDSSAVNPGDSYADYSANALVLGNGGGGGDVAVYGSRGTTAGSGGGGGRGSLNTTGTYVYGYNGTAGLNGLAIVRYPAPPSLTPEPYSGPLITQTSVAAIPGKNAVRVRVSGSKLGVVEKLQINNVVVPFTYSASGDLTFDLSAFPAGTYDIVLISSSGKITHQDGLVIPKSVSKVLSTKRIYFAPDSTRLSASSKSSIGSFVAQGNSAIEAICTGYTSGVRSSATDLRIARNRAIRACKEVQNLLPGVKTTVLARPAAGLGAKYRSADIQLVLP